MNNTDTETTWKPFFFESNQFFDTIRGMADWERLKAAYPDMSDDELLDAKEATYKGNRPQEERDAHPNYGLRYEHDGERTLRGFFEAQGMSLPNTKDLPTANTEPRKPTDNL